VVWLYDIRDTIYIYTIPISRSEEASSSLHGSSIGSAHTTYKKVK